MSQPQPRGYLLSQPKNVVDILQQARLTDNKTVDTPIEINVRYSFSDSLPLTDSTLYRTIVESLVYLTINRLDNAYVVHVVSQFVASPTTFYWTTVLRILRYLHGTVFQSLLLLSTSSLQLVHTLMLIMTVIPQIANLLPVFISFQVIFLFLGRARNNLLFLILQPKHNIML